MRLIAVLLIINSNVLAQAPDYIPPGTVPVREGFFVDATEIANVHWAEFEFYVNRDSLTEFSAYILPSALVTNNYRPNYYRHAGFRYHPVVGVTKLHAENYCRWRTMIVNQKLQLMFETNVINMQINVLYRLPSEKEWTEIAQRTDTIKQVSPRSYLIEQFVEARDLESMRRLLNDETITIRKVKKGIIDHRNDDRVPASHVNRIYPWFAHNEDKLPMDVHFPATAEDYKYKQHTAPLNMVGNVAELVSESGIVKGGSWRHQLAVSFPSKSIEIDPNKVYDWVGFRCVCEVFEVKMN